MSDYFEPNRDAKNDEKIITDVIHRAHVIRAYARGVGRTIQEIKKQPVPKGPHREGIITPVSL